jgi:outer membrane protein OmpA-like peptidoglycan-associated protein
MGFVNSAVILAIALVLGACAHKPQWGNAPRPVETEAVRPGHGQAGNELVVLLPKANGSVGAVVVRSGGSDAVILDKPYAAASIEGAGRVQPLTYNADRAKKEFSAALTALPGRPVTYLLYFLEGKDDLTPDSEREVERIFADIAARPDPEISVVGHTDAVGTMQYNDQLSLQRAQRVREDLTRRGVPDKYIELAGRGKRDPVVRTAAGAPEPMNRRVEIIVR